jgi:hypothetical protein
MGILKDAKYIVPKGARNVKKNNTKILVFLNPILRNLVLISDKSTSPIDIARM